MSKLKVAEIFYSLQGEGLWVGVPSVFLRTFGCNFQCRGFGMPAGELTDEPEKIAKEIQEKGIPVSYEELPLALTGCDSYASWHPAFKTLSPTMDIDTVMHEIEVARTSCAGATANDGQVHLVITGGEPLLGWQRAYPELFEKAKEKGYKHFTFETNGTQEIKDDFADYLLRNQITDNDSSLTFSVSPKLPCSGEKLEDALKPEIVASYQKYGTVYLKFVVANMDDLKSVTYFRDAYKEAGWNGETYLMPCGGDPDLYNLTAPVVAWLAMEYGYRYSPRLQVDIWKNEWGT